jgi:tRNA threonylcarbamoyladenosine biosynthesis protein TsaB
MARHAARGGLVGMLLAIDTSTALASVAVLDDERLLVELTWQVGPRHSSELFTRIELAMGMSRLTPADLTGIAVASGPGSFNGLRVAVSAAKAFAFARGLPVYAHPTLDVIAWGYAGAGQPVWAVLDAGRGQVYCAHYPTPATSAMGWGPLDGYHILTPEELATRATGTALICGEWRAETGQALAAALGERARWAVPVAPRRAAWLGELARTRATSGAPDDILHLEPLYLRRPAVTQSRRARMGKGTVSTAETPGE